MQVNELRIGNVVMSFGKIAIIRSINSNYDKTHLYFNVVGDSRRHSAFLDDNKDIKGIPLTPELLEAVGFENRVENAGNIPCFKKGNLTIALWIKGKWQAWYKLADIYNSPQHLHQLQNIVFALTGTELEIDLKKLTKLLTDKN